MTKEDAMLAMSWKYVPDIYKKIIEYLDLHGQGTAYEIAGYCHRVVPTVQAALKLMQIQYKCVRPAAWYRHSNAGPPYPAWELGSGKGVAPPLKKTSSEKCRAWRLKKRIKAGKLPTMAQMARAA